MNEHDRQRRLIQRMLDYAQMDATNLARRAGIAHTTVTRFLNKSSEQLLSHRTLAKLLQASGLPQSEAEPWPQRPGTELAQTDPQVSGYLVNQADQVALLMLWDGLSTPEKIAVLRHIESLRGDKKTGAA